MSISGSPQDKPGETDNVGWLLPAAMVALGIALFVMALLFLRKATGRRSTGGRSGGGPVRRESAPSTRIPNRVKPVSSNTEQEEEPYRPASGAAGRDIDLPSDTMPEQEGGVRSQYHVGVGQCIGQREDQEDAYAVSQWRDADVVARQGILAAVADGIGGLDDGQVASVSLMRSLAKEFDQLDPALSPENKLLELTARGQQEVLRINRSGKRCGTTLVAVLIKDGSLSAISVGDSRIALYRSGVLLQLNREHVSAREKDEQQALEGTPPLEGKKRGALTSYIGMEGLRQMDRTMNPIRLIAGDRVLLMSDGVFGTLSDDQLIAQLNQDPQSAADAIIREVNKQGKRYQDNATIVIVGLD